MEPVGSLLEFVRATRTDTLCVSDGHGFSLTGSQLATRVRMLTEELEVAGCRIVGLHLDNGPDWVVADLAVHAADLVLVPLPTFFSSGQVRHILNATAIDSVLTTQPEALPVFGQVTRPIDCGPLLLLKLKTTGRPELPPGTDKVTFTSGSTGQPKGVCLRQQQLMNQARVLAAAAGLKRPRHLCVLPLSTLLENIGGVYAPLLSEGEIVAPPLETVGLTGSSSLDTVRFLDVITRQRPNSLILTPQLLQLLVSAADKGWRPPASLAFVAVGGARVPTGLIDTAHELGIPAFEGYGLSECASVVSLNRPGAERPGTCGRPLPHVHVTIVDGEVRVSGNAMLGYVGEPESWNLETIATGDLGSLDDDGYLHINGRRKNLLVSSYGRNISPEWVESELLADGRIEECIVLGDARPWCVALLRPRDVSMTDKAIEATIDRCNLGLPDYACIRGWRRLPESFAATGGLLTENGRPRRNEIRAHYEHLVDALYTSAANTEPSEVKIA